MNRESKILKTFKIKNGRVTRRVEAEMNNGVTMRGCKKCGAFYMIDVVALKEDKGLCGDCIDEQRKDDDNERQG